MLEAPQIEHADAAVGAAADEDVNGLRAEAYVKYLLVVSDELSFGGEGWNVPYCTCGVDT